MARRMLAEDIGEELKAVARERVGYDQAPRMRAPVGEEAQRERDEVIPVTRDEAAPFAGRPVELLQIREALRADFVCAHGIDASRAQELGDRGAQVLVQVVLQEPLTAREG